MLETVINLIFIAAMALCFAVGGEYRFGKGKRGLLLAIPLTLYGLKVISWLGLAIQAGILYAIYQCLFYDDGIELVYEKHDKKGWLIIGLNGAMIGLTCCMFGVATGRLASIFAGVAAGILGFVGVVRLSNDAECAPYRTWLTKNGPQYLPYKDDKGNNGFYVNFKDAWWVSEAIIGAILAVTLVLCLR